MLVRTIIVILIQAILKLPVNSSQDTHSGGVEARVSSQYKGVITLSMKNFDKVKNVDTTSRTALIQGGIFGPKLEAQLKQVSNNHNN